VGIVRVGGGESGVKGEWGWDIGRGDKGDGML